MNREQKRTFVKKAQEKGVNRDIAKIYAETLWERSGAGTHTPPQDINEGEKLMLDVDKIKSRRDYERMTDKYKEFINSNVDTVFTAHVERKTLISFAEEPEWLFWCGDLIKIEKETDTVCKQ